MEGGECVDCKSGGFALRLTTSGWIFVGSALAISLVACLVGSRLSARRTTGPRLPTVAAAAALDQTDPLPRVKAVTVDHNDAASHQVRVITFDLRLTNCQHSPANRQLRILPRKYAHHVCPLSVFVALPLALYVDGIHAACQRCRPESVRLGAPGDGKGQ